MSLPPPPPQKQIFLPVSPTRSSSAFSFIALDGAGVSDKLVGDCAKLFSANYGVWGQLAGPSLSGKRVKMSADKLKKQCLSIPESTVLVTCFKDGDLVGHAFATIWEYDGGKVGWVTQLVVDTTVRKRYVATQLLQTFKRHRLFADVNAVGLVSSHPAAVNALTKYCNVSVDMIDTDFITANTTKILETTPIEYLKDAKLRGSLFEDNCISGAVSCMFTEFYVDHAEPSAALAIFKGNRRWSLGDLPEGHEFLIIVPV